MAPILALPDASLTCQNSMCIFFSPSKSFCSYLPAGVRAGGLTLQMSTGHVQALLEGCYSETEGALLSLRSAGFWTAPGSSQELGVSDSWCGRKVEGGDKKPSEGISSLRALHPHHTPASERAQGVCLWWRTVNSEPPVTTLCSLILYNTGTWKCTIKQGAS